MYAPMTGSETDVELVRLIGEGGASQAETEMCRRFAPRIRLYGLRHLKSEDRARDLVQAVLLAVLQAARGRRIENPEHLARYVLGTCRNVANRQRDVERRFTPTGESELDCESFVPELDVLATAALMRCMSRLDYRARTVMWLTFNEERPSDRIAAALETTPGNVRVLRHRAMSDLRRCMGVTK